MSVYELVAALAAAVVVIYAAAVDYTAGAVWASVAYAGIGAWYLMNKDE